MFKTLCFIFFCFFVTSVSAAPVVGSIGVVAENGFTPAVSLYRPRPKYPDKPLLIQSQKEAWMAVDFIIDKKGKVKSPVIVVSNGDQAFMDAGLKTLKKWQFKPAQLAGKPIEQGNNIEVLGFRITGKQLAASRVFIQQFNAIWELIDEKQFVPAFHRLLDLELQPRLNLYEDAWYWFLKSHYYLSRGEDLLAITHLKNAIVNGSIYLPKDKYRIAVSNLYMALVRQNQFVAALKVAKQFKQFKSPDKTLTKLIAHAEKLQAAKPKLVDFSSAYIVNNHGIAGHQLAASEFTIDVSGGELTTFELRCDKQSQLFKYNPKGQWQIPNSWGSCNVVFKGKPGTILILAERF